MNTTRKTLLSAFGLLLSFCLVFFVLAVLLTGCAVLDKGYDKQAVFHDATTNVVTKYVTNTVVLPPVTNIIDNTVSAPVVRTVVMPTIETVITPAYYTTNLVDKPIVTGAVAMAEALPVPYAGLAGGGLALLYSMYRNIRNKKALVAIVQGIDEGRKLLQTTPELQGVDAKIKDILIKHQEVAGVLTQVSGIVNQYTGDTVPPKG